MDRSPLMLIAAVVGFIAMVAGFAGYVIDPKTSYAAVFAVGLILLMAAYVLLSIENRSSIENRRIDAAAQVIDDRESAEGYVYYMHGVPEDNPATIVDLRER